MVLGVSETRFSLEMHVCSALITNNIRELIRIRDEYGFDSVSIELRKEAESRIGKGLPTKTPWFIKWTYWLPASIQMLGQRAVLLSPKLANKILRSSGIHHQWY